MELFAHSPSQKKLLMMILSRAHVEKDISLDKFEGIVSHTTTNNYFTFTDDEIPSKDRGHNKALHNFIKCKNHFISCVLIDNGLCLNVMPKAPFNKLPANGICKKLFWLKYKREGGGELDFKIFFKTI